MEPQDSGKKEFAHTSVLLSECLEGLQINPDGLYVDGTLGGGGHAREICRRLTENGRLVGIDRDADAIRAASEVLRLYPNTVLVRDNFTNIRNIFAENALGPADGFLLDLGVSSYQFDEGARGFSYMHDAQLDMRMDQSAELSAYEVVNGYPESELRRIIADYGEERWAGRIAQFIAARRVDKPITTTFELVGVIKNAVPKAARADGPHPAKRTFQALRIEVNHELGGLEAAVGDMVSLLKPGGRICVITFHSLEDRIIKNAFRRLENPCTCPRELPRCVCGKEAQVRILTRKPILPGADEMENNRRAHSAKLRIAEKR